MINRLALEDVKEREIEITPEMIEAGLEWLYAYNPEINDGPQTVENIIRAALANSSQNRPTIAEAGYCISRTQELDHD